MNGTPNKMCGAIVLCLLGLTLVMGGAARAQFDDTWSFTVGGQTTAPRPNGSFDIANVSAADAFGPGGPGTAPDFLSDDYLRVLGTRTVNGVTTYAFSDRFKISQGQTYVIPDLTITSTPPPTPIALRITAPVSVLELNQTVQLTTTGTLQGGSMQDLTPATAWTTYRTSNPATATVSADGLVTAHGVGRTFITSVNDAASSVKRIDVTSMTIMTTVEGFVQLSDGTPVENADVTTTGAFGGMGVSGADGHFVMPLSLPLEATTITVRANATLGGAYLGLSSVLAVMPGGVTDAGSITLLPTDSGMALIPAGEFVMGDHHDGQSVALPLHTVYIDAFYMDRFEVTNQQYADALNWAWDQGGLISVTSGYVWRFGGTSIRYCTTTSADSTSRITWNGRTFGVTAGKENHPMVHVTWYGSAAYSNWRSGMEGLTPSYDTSTWVCNFAGNGYRLPTEAEWEKAARGGHDNPYYRYPWGNSLNGSQANYWESGDPFESGNYPWTTPVGYYNGSQTPPGVDMANGYGLYDMSGNVWEWCHDWYAGNYYSTSPSNNPRGPTSGTFRVIRGGSWIYDVYYLTCAIRYIAYPYDGTSIIGFRLALNSE